MFKRGSLSFPSLDIVDGVRLAYSYERQRGGL